MRKLLPLLALVLLLAPTTLADDARAQEILKQARQAIGGEEQLQKIPNVTVLRPRHLRPITAAF